MQKIFIYSKLESNAFNYIMLQLTTNLFSVYYIHLCITKQEQISKTIPTWRTSAMSTWEFGLLAGVARCSGVAATPKIIGHNGTFSFSSLSWIRKDRGTRDD